MDEDGESKYQIGDVGDNGDIGNNDDVAYNIGADEDCDDDYDNDNHLMRNGGDKGVGPVTTSQVEIATIHKVQPGNSSLLPVSSSSLPLSS